MKKGSPGYRATKIENKIGLRMVQNGDIVMKDVFVADEDRIPGINSFQDTNKVLLKSEATRHNIRTPGLYFIVDSYQKPFVDAFGLYFPCS